MALTKVSGSMSATDIVKTTDIGTAAYQSVQSIVDTAYPPTNAVGQVLQASGSGVQPTWVYPSHVQTVRSTFGTRTTVSGATSQVPGDDTIPQQTEGFEVLTASITPKASTHKLRITAVVPFSMAATNTTTVLALYRDGGANAIAVTWHDGDASTNYSHEIWTEVVAGSTAATTFKLRIGPTSNVDIYLCGNSSSRLFGGAMLAQMTIDEYKA